MKKQEYDYVRCVAQEPVTQEEALEFLQGLERHNKQTRTCVDYDVVKTGGFIVTQTREFPSFEEAWSFARGLHGISITRPTIYSPE